MITLWFLRKRWKVTCFFFFFLGREVNCFFCCFNPLLTSPHPPASFWIVVCFFECCSLVILSNLRLNYYLSSLTALLGIKWIISCGMAHALVLLHSLPALDIQCLFSWLTSACVAMFVNKLMVLKHVYWVNCDLLVLLFLHAHLRPFKEYIRTSDLYSFWRK